MKRLIATAALLLPIVGCADCSTDSVDEDAGAVDAGAVDAGDVVPDASPLADPADPATWVREPDRPDLPARPMWDPKFGPFLSESAKEGAFCNRDTGDTSHITIGGRGDRVAVGVEIYNNHFLDPLDAPWAHRPSGIAIHEWNATTNAWTERLWAPSGVVVDGFQVAPASDGGLFILWDHGCRLSLLQSGPFSASSLGCGFDGFNATERPYRFATRDGQLSTLVTTERFLHRSEESYVNLTSLSDLATNGGFIFWNFADFGSRILASESERTIAVDYDVTSSTLTDYGNIIPAGYLGAIGRLPDGRALVTYGPDALFMAVDENGFEQLSTDDTECDGYVSRLQEHAGTTYYITSSEFGWVDETGAHSIANMTGCSTWESRFLDMTTADSGIYLLVEDREYINFQCGSAYVVKFDGTSFESL